MGLELAKVFVSVRADNSKLLGDFSKVKGPITKQAASIGGTAGTAFGSAYFKTARPAIAAATADLTRLGVGAGLTAHFVSMGTSAGNTVGKSLGSAYLKTTKQAVKASGPVLTRIFGGLGESTGKSFSTGFARFGFAILGFLAAKEAVMFEKAMIDVRANARLMGKEGEEAFQKLTRTARELGATTQFTAMQAAASLNRLVLGGLSVI